MNDTLPNFRSHVTLVFCTILHAFTHALATLLVPLLIMVTSDLHLSGVKMTSLLITIYGVTYWLLSFPSGMLADRFNRKALLGFGLIGNGIAVLGMGLTRDYSALVVFSFLAGLAGTLFHPAIATLVPAHYPKAPGMAIGLVGMGAGIGFFAGPQFAGWRAESAQWHFGSVAQWQKPCIEMGIAAVVTGILFLVFAQEISRRRDDQSPRRIIPMPPGMKRRVIAMAAVLGCRDFAGVACMTLASLYLQKVHGKSPKETGFIVGSMMLLSVVVNPVAVALTGGRKRLPALSIILLAGAFIIATGAFWPVEYILLGLSLFQCSQLGSYAVSDAAILERVSPDIRGRVIGLFLSLAGTWGSLSPWIMGFWVDSMGDQSQYSRSFIAPFATLGAMMAIAACSTPLIHRMGKADKPPVDPLSEVSPPELGPIG